MWPNGRLLMLAAGICLLAGLPDACAARARPNVLLILCDDLGFSDLGCYGGEIRTPNLDRLAAEGMRFTQFYNCAVCVTTRAALTTGLHPRQGKYTHVPNEGAQVHIGLMTDTARFTEEAYYDARVAVSILSGGMSARLFTEVREKRGLCYAIGARYHISHGRSIAPGLLCFARANKDICAEAFEEIAWQLNRSGDLEEGLRKLYGEVGLPTRFRELDVPEADLPRIAFEGSKDVVNIAGNPLPLGEREILKLLKEFY